MLKLNSRSVRFRLTAWYAAILTATFCVVAIFIWLALKHSIRATVDNDLRARLATARSYIQNAGSKGMSHLRKELNEDVGGNSGSAYLRVADNNGSWIYESPETRTWLFKAPNRGDLPPRGLVQTVRVNGKSVRVLSAPIGIGLVQIAFPLEEFDELQRDFIWTIVVAGPLLLFVACAGGYWLSGRALRPVAQIASAARRITARNLSERLPSSGTGDELDRLSQILNDMLAGLDSAFRRITQFTADASHELRTPLAIIRTTAEVIRGRSRTLEEHDRAWASILAQTERTSQLVEDLLTLTRADSGSGTLHLEPIELGRVVAGACSDMQVLAESNGLQLHFADLAQCAVLCDIDAVHRVFTILLDNAIKATPPGGKITVSLSVDREREREVGVVAVKDTGCGIPGEDLPFIFDRFYRVNKDRSRETGGAGLGLSIAQSILARHGGTVDVRSHAGVGSTFVVRFPLITDQRARSEILQNQKTS